jgi:hypothetical protein
VTHRAQNAGRRALTCLPGGGQVGSGEGQDQKDQRKQCRLFGMVRPRGLEPPRVAPLAPQASASANSATAACGVDAHQRGGGVERSETHQGILARLLPRVRSAANRQRRAARSSPRLPLSFAAHRRRDRQQGLNRWEAIQTHQM